MTACPPTTRYLTPLRLKALNSSSKSEFIQTAGTPGMYVYNHLPRRFKDRMRAEALPIFDIEGTIHFSQPAVAFHHERRRWLGPHASTILQRRLLELRRLNSRRFLQAALLNLSLPHHVLLNLAGDGHWKRVDKAEILRDLEVRDAALAVLANFSLAAGLTGLELDPASDRL